MDCPADGVAGIEINASSQFSMWSIAGPKSRSDITYTWINGCPLPSAARSNVSEEVESGIVLDYNADNQVVGIEILRLKERVPAANLKQTQFEVA